MKKKIIDHKREELRILKRVNKNMEKIDEIKYKHLGHLPSKFNHRIHELEEEIRKEDRNPKYINFKSLKFKRVRFKK